MGCNVNIETCEFSINGLVIHRDEVQEKLSSLGLDGVMNIVDQARALDAACQPLAEHLSYGEISGIKYGCDRAQAPVFAALLLIILEKNGAFEEEDYSGVRGAASAYFLMGDDGVEPGLPNELSM